MVEGAGRSVYFAGDTDVFAGMAELAPVDVALLPIWGWGPTMGPGHMDPDRAAEAAALLEARLAIPIHWGTYYPVHLGLRGPPAFLQTPPPLFEQADAGAVAGDRGTCAPARASARRSELSLGYADRRRYDSTPTCTERWNASGPIRSVIPARSRMSVRSVFARANSSVTPLIWSWSSRSSSIASAVVSAWLITDASTRTVCAGGLGLVDES